MSQIIVIALGGNALIKPGEEGTIDQMRKNIRQALENILNFINPEASLIITHGNGPQVGTLLLKDDAGKNLYDTPNYPLDTLVAETQGEIAYLIESELRNLLSEKKWTREVASLVTMIEVNPEDPAFLNPQKRVGKMYTKEEAEKLGKEKKWTFALEIKNGREVYRRVVPSPEPQDVINKKVITTLIQQNFILITAGGGGIPVSKKKGKLFPVEAVIDKDLASALVAEIVHAEQFIILTDVPYVYQNYGTENQQAIEHLTIAEAEEMIKNGVFGKGNMLPKILAALHFSKRTGERALITNFEGLLSRKGTVIGG